MHASFPILLAGVNEVISVLVGLAFFVIWVINQINDAKKKQVAQEQRKQAEAMQQAGAPNAAPAPPPADPLRAQVDEFLRRAGKQPAPGRPQPKAQKSVGRDEVVVLLDESAAAPPPRKTLAEKMRIKVEAAKVQRAKPTASQIPRTQPPRPQQRGPSPTRPQTVVEHVTQHVSSASEAFRQEVADLGQSVRQADEQFDVQLHKKFDHELGSLGPSTGTTATNEAGSPPRSTASPASQIAAMLANPEGIRQAIIVNEILHRPSDRW